MKEKSIIIDLDNVIVDTSIRKQKLLKGENSIDKSLDAIREDYELKSAFGNTDSDAYKQFFKTLNSNEAITKYKAKPFDNSIQTIRKFKDRKIKIIILTARPISTEKSTIEELSEFGLKEDEYQIHFANDDLITNTQVEEYKSTKIVELLETHSILGIIGDRESDINAGLSNNLSTIYFSPINKGLTIQNPHGHFNCNDWGDIDKIVNTLDNGKNELLSDLRKIMIEQYSKWLSDIDNKLRISVTIAGILSAISGKLIHDGLDFSNYFYCPTTIGSIALILCFVFAMISIMFCIRGYTSRYTSGKKASDIISAPSESNWWKERCQETMFQFFTLIKSDKRNNYLSDNDYINRYNYIKNKDDELPFEHFRFFYKKYKTYDEDALLNQRLFAVLAANYSKVYPEVIASKYLVRSILMVLVYVLCKILTQLNIL